ELTLFAHILFAWPLYSCSQGNFRPRRKSKAQVVGGPVSRRGILKQFLRWYLELNHNLCRGTRHILTGPNEPRHAFPSPGIDRHAQRAVGFHIRIRVNLSFVSVPQILASHQLFGQQGTHSPENLGVFKLNSFVRTPCRWHHATQAYPLEEM